MALERAHWTFTWAAADPVGTTYAHTFPFTVKAIRVWCTGRAGTTNGAGAGNLRASLGFAASTASRGCTGASVNDAQGNAQAASILRTDAVLGFPTIDGAGPEALLDVDALGGTGLVRFIVDDQGVQDVQVEVEALGGDDLAQAAVVLFTLPAVAGPFDVTTFGFEPTCTWFATSIVSAAPPGAGSDACVSLGAATDAGHQFVVAGACNNGDAITVTDGYARGDECIALITNGAVTARASFVQTVANGIRLNCLTPFFNLRVLALGIEGARWQAGTVVLPTTNGGTVDITTGWRPKILEVVSHQRPQSTAGTADDGDQVSFGLALETTERLVGAWFDENGVTESDVFTGRRDDAVYMKLDGDGAEIARADVEAFLSTGARLTVPVADGVAALVGYVAGASTEDEPEPPALAQFPPRILRP